MTRGGKHPLSKNERNKSQANRLLMSCQNFQDLDCQIDFEKPQEISGFSKPNTKNEKA